jgi:hypothetical protein
MIPSPLPLRSLPLAEGQPTPSFSFNPPELLLSLVMLWIGRIAPSVVSPDGSRVVWRSFLAAERNLLESKSEVFPMEV